MRLAPHFYFPFHIFAYLFFLLFVFPPSVLEMHRHVCSVHDIARLV